MILKVGEFMKIVQVYNYSALLDAEPCDHAHDEDEDKVCPSIKDVFIFFPLKMMPSEYKIFKEKMDFYILVSNAPCALTNACIKL